MYVYRLRIGLRDVWSLVLRRINLFQGPVNPHSSRATRSIRTGHLHVLYENSIVYGHICMYYRISIFQKTAISILDSVYSAVSLVYHTPLQPETEHRARVPHPHPSPPRENAFILSPEFSIRNIENDAKHRFARGKVSAKRAFTFNFINTELEGCDKYAGFGGISNVKQTFERCSQISQSVSIIFANFFVFGILS